MNEPEREIPVSLAEAPYSVHVRPGLLREIGARLKARGVTRVGIMRDSHLGDWSDVLQAGCEEAGISTLALHVVPAGEPHKTFEQIGRAVDAFLSQRIERSTPILALGGGMIGDMAGFTAAIVLRGVPFVQIPTSLLAMVDASVGGKTGVNHAAGKNLIGAFHQPLAVFADTAVLSTLPRRELVGGLAECIKHDCIRDAAGFAWLERNLDRILAVDPAALTELVAHNVAIKAKVVEADPFERGERAHLNFGHTFGHAIEKVSNFAYSHGEAVALGIAAASYTSTRLGLLSDTERRRIVDLLRRAGLPVGGLTLEVDPVIEAMAFDKKVERSRIRFVLLNGLGAAVVRNDVPAELVREAVESIRG